MTIKTLEERIKDLENMMDWQNKTIGVMLETTEMLNLRIRTLEEKWEQV